VIGLLVAAAGVAAEERIRVAILPIVVYSLGDDQYLRLGLGNMLASRIGSDPRLAVVQLDRAELATTDPEAAREAARSAGADYVLYGSFTRFGEGASLDLQCASVLEEGVTGREIFIQTGTLREIIPKLGPLAEKVVRYVAGTAPAAAQESPAPPLDGAGQSVLEALQERVEVLEEAVFSSESTPSSPAAEQEEAGAERLESEVGADPEAPGPEEALASEDAPEGERAVPDQKAETMR
jgi:hypothetical protein